MNATKMIEKARLLGTHIDEVNPIVLGNAKGSEGLGKRLRME
jgi:hypothetical protein